MLDSGPRIGLNQLLAQLLELFAEGGILLTLVGEVPFEATHSLVIGFSIRTSISLAAVQTTKAHGGDGLVVCLAFNTTYAPWV